MNKKICDRCGAEIVNKKTTFRDSLAELVYTLKLAFGAKHRVKYRIEIVDLDEPKFPRPMADLCEQCEKDLIAFMNNKKDAENENEVIECGT